MGPSIRAGRCLCVHMALVTATRPYCRNPLRLLASSPSCLLTFTVQGRVSPYRLSVNGARFGRLCSRLVTMSATTVAAVAAANVLDPKFMRLIVKNDSTRRSGGVALPGSGKDETQHSVPG